MSNENCKEFLKAFRKVVGAKPEETIDKRYKPYLAPNDKYYEGHCGYCAEVKYLSEIYDEKPSSIKVTIEYTEDEDMVSAHCLRDEIQGINPCFKVVVKDE